ncbi:MAG: hypothetical protein Q8P41_09985 [Pseudomonadota bacterium]|nr:hypothetical protein [Pseudomonadota bacterium]
MAGSVSIEVDVAGTKLVASGTVFQVTLSERLDAAAELIVALQEDGDAASVINALTFGATATVQLLSGTSPVRTVACTLMEIQNTFDPVDGWTVQIRAVDALVKLKNKYRTKLWEASPSAIVNTIVGEYGWSAVLQGLGSDVRLTLQDNISDAEMLRLIAEENGCTMVLDGTQLRFGHALDTTKVTLTEADLISAISVTRTAQDIPTQVDVVDKAPSSDTVVQGTATTSDLQDISSGTTACAVVQATWGAVLLPQESAKVDTATEAKAKATAILQRRAEQFLRGTLTCLGQPTARPGRLLTITEFGRFNGTYRIAATTHAYGADAGYLTTIDFYSDSTPTDLA